MFQVARKPPDQFNEFAQSKSSRPDVFCKIHRKTPMLELLF